MSDVVSNSVVLRPLLLVPGKKSSVMCDADERVLWYAKENENNFSWVSGNEPYGMSALQREPEVS